MSLDFLRVYKTAVSKIRLGPRNDGGYVIADIDSLYDLLVSCGIADDVTFEKDFLAKYRNVCEAVAFDGSVSSLPEHVQCLEFVKKNVDCVNSEMTTDLVDVISIYDNVFLKMDIETHEFGWLQMIPQEVLRKVKQLVIEFHYPFSDASMPVEEKVATLAKLTDTHTLIHLHANNCCGTTIFRGVQVPNVFECAYVRNDCHAFVGFNDVPLPHPLLDAPNVADRPDIVLDGYPFVQASIPGLVSAKPFSAVYIIESRHDSKEKEAKRWYLSESSGLCGVKPILCNTCTVRSTKVLVERGILDRKCDFLDAQNCFPSTTPLAEASRCESHVALWRAIVEARHAWTVILEDGVTLEQSLFGDADYMRYAWSSLPANAGLAYLGFHVPFHSVGDSKFATRINASWAHITGDTHGTYAYALSFAGACYLLKKHLPLRRAVDYFPQSCADFGVYALCSVGTLPGERTLATDGDRCFFGAASPESRNIAFSDATVSVEEMALWERCRRSLQDANAAPCVELMKRYHYHSSRGKPYYGIASLIAAGTMALAESDPFVNNHSQVAYESAFELSVFAYYSQWRAMARDAAVCAMAHPRASYDDTHTLRSNIAFAQAKVLEFAASSRLAAHVRQQLLCIGERMAARSRSEFILANGAEMEAATAAAATAMGKEKTTVYFNAIVVVNLERRPERWARTYAALCRHGVQHLCPIFRFRAVNAGSAAQEYREFTSLAAKYPGCANIERPGVLGCLMSHRCIWKEALRRNFDRLLILEDDVCLHRSFVPRLRENMQRLDAHDANWQCAYLGSVNRWSQSRLPAISPPLAGFARPNFDWCTFAYALQRPALEQLIHSPSLFHGPVDVGVLSQYCQMNVEHAYVMQPALVISDCRESDTCGNGVSDVDWYAQQCGWTLQNYEWPLELFDDRGVKYDAPEKELTPKKATIRWLYTHQLPSAVMPRAASPSGEKEKDNDLFVHIDEIRQIDFENDASNAEHVLILVEPKEVAPTILRKTLFSDVDLWSRRYNRILSHDPEVLALFKGSEYANLNAVTWLSESERKKILQTPKRLAVSFVCGSYCRTQGHRLRQAVWKKQPFLTGIAAASLDFFVSSRDETLIENPCKNPVLGGSKEPLFTSMFHVCIENVQQHGYFTEKLLDCLLTRTVPIYWGCPNIGDYFDVRGLMLAQSEDEVCNAIAKCNEIEYRSRLPFIELNFALACSWAGDKDRDFARLLGLYQVTSLFGMQAQRPMPASVPLLLVPTKQPLQGLAKEIQSVEAGKPLATLVFFGDASDEKKMDRLEKEAKEMGVFDFILRFTPESLEADFLDQHGAFLQKNKRGYGFYLWKPYIILQTIKLIRENDILIYADAGCTFNRAGLPRLFEYIELARKSPCGNVSFQLQHEEKRFTKRDLFARFGEDCYPKLGETKQLLAGVFILRKCAHTMSLIEQWHAFSQQYHSIDDTPSLLKNSDDFVEHRHDESVFSLVRKLGGTVAIPDETSFAPQWELHGKAFPIWATQKQTV